MNYTPPFRLGKKQTRAILDSLGIEVIVFKKGDEHLAEFFVEKLNEEFKPQIICECGSKNVLHEEKEGRGLPPKGYK